jgi:hypothetical protein
MDLFNGTCPNLGSSFILIKRIDRIICFASRFLTNHFFADFFLFVDWFQKLVKDSKENGNSLP